jgi:hypothetical protein
MAAGLGRRRRQILWKRRRRDCDGHVGENGAALANHALAPKMQPQDRRRHELSLDV